jgi:integrase
MARAEGEPWFRSVKDAWYVWHEGRQVSLRVRGEGNRPEAVKAWHRLMAGDAAPKARQAPKPTPQAAEPVVSVKAVFDGFLSNKEGRVRPQSLSRLRRFLEAFAGRFGQRPADTILPHEVEAFANRPGWKVNTRRHAVASVVQAFRWGVKARMLTANPVAGTELPPVVSRGAEHVITPDEHRRLLAGAWPCFRPLLEALYLTGARPGELAGLTVADVAETIPLKAHKTAHKGKARVLYLSPAALAFFREHGKGRSGLLFVNRYGRKWTADAIGKSMRAACRRAGLPVKHAYGYRHGYATQALASGVPDATVAALLGHSGTAMLHRHYSHLTSQAQVLREAAARVRR